jgi:hypothetical protein
MFDVFLNYFQPSTSKIGEFRRESYYQKAGSYDRRNSRVSFAFANLIPARRGALQAVEETEETSTPQKQLKT